MQHLTKDQVIKAAENSFEALTQLCNHMADADFFSPPANKWSVAQHIKHLVVSTNTTTLAYRMPGFILTWIAGKPNRNSRSYEELVAKYQQKLAEGGRATGRFVPPAITEAYGKQALMKQWSKATSKFIQSVTKNCTETNLDDYLVRHPLLGRITLRELGYFTIYHTEHHLKIIQSLHSSRH
jgi:hypothetical protein